MSAVEQSGTVDYLKGYYDEDVLMNRTNIALLEAGGYKYIIGARIKNENEEIRKWIMTLEKKDGSFYEKTKPEGCRLIVGYSASRAKKDAYNRGKGIRRLRKAYGNGRITKDNINRRGYNKFLELTDQYMVNLGKHLFGYYVLEVVAPSCYYRIEHFYQPALCGLAWSVSPKDVSSRYSFQCKPFSVSEDAHFVFTPLLCFSSFKSSSIFL